MQREQQERARRAQLQRVAGEDDAAPIVEVRDVTGGQREEDAGEKKRETGIAERKCRVGELVDLPGDADGLGLGAHDAQEAGGGIEAEIAVLPGYGGREPALTVTFCHGLWFHMRFVLRLG